LKNRYHILIIIILLYLSAQLKDWMNNLKIEQENQESISGFWILFSTGYTFYVLYRLYIKYPKIFNPDYKKQIAQNKKNKSNVVNLQNNLSNNLKKIEVIDVRKIEEQIRINEKEIIAIDRKYLQDLIRLKNYIENIKSLVEARIYEISDDLNANIYDYCKIVKELKNQNKNLSDLYIITFSMIENLLNEDLTSYHITYEKLDSLGIFESHFEKQLSGNLLQVSSELSEIKSSLNYSNILLSYNTYQLHSVSKGVKEIKKELIDIKKKI